MLRNPETVKDGFRCDLLGKNFLIKNGFFPYGFDNGKYYFRGEDVRSFLLGLPFVDKWNLFIFGGINRSLLWP